jgi:hypothetical protein
VVGTTRQSKKFHVMTIMSKPRLDQYKRTLLDRHGRPQRRTTSR